jgi:hypothetical protein
MLTRWLLAQPLRTLRLELGVGCLYSLSCREGLFPDTRQYGSINRRYKGLIRTHKDLRADDPLLAFAGWRFSFSFYD